VQRAIMDCQEDLVSFDMLLSVPTKISLDKWATWVFNVATLNQEADMETKVKEMIKEWIKKDGGDKERTAKWMSRIHLCGIKEARRLIEEAVA
jgi:hypothetical protein